MEYTVTIEWQINERLVRLFLFSWYDSCRGPGLLIVEVSRSQSKTPNSVGLLSARGRMVAETSTENTQQTREADICNADGFETANPAINIIHTQTQYLNIIRSFTFIFICCVPFVPFDHHQLKVACIEMEKCVIEGESL